MFLAQTGDNYDVIATEQSLWLWELLAFNDRALKKSKQLIQYFNIKDQVSCLQQFHAKRNQLTKCLPSVENNFDEFIEEKILINKKTLLILSQNFMSLKRVKPCMWFYFSASP